MHGVGDYNTFSLISQVFMNPFLFLDATGTREVRWGVVRLLAFDQSARSPELPSTALVLASAPRVQPPSVRKSVHQREGSLDYLADAFHFFVLYPSLNAFSRC